MKHSRGSPRTKAVTDRKLKIRQGRHGSACWTLFLVVPTSSEKALSNDNGDSRMDNLWVEAL